MFSNLKFKNEDGSVKVPHTLVLISCILLFVAMATYIIPGGAYERFVNETGRELVVDGSFQLIENQPQGLFEVLKAPISGIEEAAEIIAFLFIVGGAFNIIMATKAIDSGINRTVHIFKGNEILIIPILMTLFSLGGAVFGMTEEALPFIAMLVPLSIALGYDSLIGMAMSYFACVIGFATAFLNPFNVGVAQQIAGIEVYSGFGLRLVLWIVGTLIGILFVMRYAARIKKNPELSPMYEIDMKRREEYLATASQDVLFTGRQKVILLTVALAMVVIVWGVLTQDFYISEIAAVFLATGVIAGIIGKLSLDEIANAFVNGAKDMLGAALMVGFARAVVIVAENGQIIDTILFNLANMVGALPSLIAGYVMYVVQMFINFFVSSGTGQAALTMPILAPLSDLIDISRQTSVLIFQLGDGFSNALFPTSGVLIGCLGMAGIPYSKWFKWILPLQGIFFLMAIIFITVAIMIGWA